MNLFNLKQSTIFVPDEGTYYIATYLKPYENATLQAQTNFDKDQEIKFLMYRLTDKTELKGCCDDYTKCPFVTENSINVADFNHWKPASFTCPKGTKQVSQVLYSLKNNLF